MSNITFNASNQNWVVRDILEADGMIRNIGWTHCAAVTRPNGKKVYYANLMINDGEVLNAMVVC